MDYKEKVIALLNSQELSKEQKEKLEYIFPELKESEGSEDLRIRREIIDYLSTVDDKELIPYESWIAWLEKRGESELPKDLGEYIAELSKQFPEVSFAKLSRIAVRVKNWLEKQGENGTNGNEREIPNSEQKHVNKVEPFDKYEGLTDFERTLADICIGWIGQELGWKQYIKDNADALLKIAIKKFNSVQDVAFEQKPAELSQSEDTKTSDQVQKPAEWSDEDEAGLSDALWAIQQARAIAKDENDIGNLWYAENWLKHLKDRYVWKPSDEQLMELKCAICGCSFNIELLVSLEEQLKQL